MRISDWSSDVCSSDLCRLLLDEGDAIVVTAPTYFTAIPIFRNFGIEFIEIGQDAHGFDIAALEATLDRRAAAGRALRSEEHTSELQSLMRISYAVFCLKKKYSIQSQQTNH